MLIDFLYYSGAVIVAVGAGLFVMVWLSRRRKVPDAGLAVVDEAMQPVRPRRYQGTRRHGERVPIAAPCTRGVVRVPRWEDPTRTTVTTQIFPPPGARGVAKVGGRRG